MRPDWLEKKIASHASLDGYVKPKAGDLLRIDSKNVNVGSHTSNVSYDVAKFETNMSSI